MRYNCGMSDPSDTADISAAWHPRTAPTLVDIELMAHDAFAKLPENFRALCEGLIIHVDDYASDEVLDDMEIDSELDLMGLFQGVGLPFRSESTSRRHAEHDLALSHSNVGLLGRARGNARLGHYACSGA